MKRLVIAALALVAVLAVAGSALGASSQSATIYDSTVNVGPKSNLSSDGLQSSQTAQIGSQVTLQSSKRNLTSATVTLSSWACVTGHWTGNGGSCVTPAGATYSLPMTLNIYDDTTGHTGHLVTSKTQTFAVAYRPSANPAKCGGPTATEWYSTTDKTCHNGLAQDVTFNFDGTKALPDTFHYGIAYGTSSYGSPPIGDQGCTTAAGCFSDSLNVALTPTADTTNATDTMFLDADGSSTGGEPGYTPAVQFKAGS